MCYLLINADYFPLYLYMKKMCSVLFLFFKCYMTQKLFFFELMMLLISPVFMVLSKLMWSRQYPVWFCHNRMWSTEVRASWRAEGVISEFFSNTQYV